VDTADSKELAVDANSAANPSHAATAAHIDPDPGPVYISAELVSGGISAKSATIRALFSAVPRIGLHKQLLRYFHNIDVCSTRSDKTARDARLSLTTRLDRQRLKESKQ
jgi:hypothetical protein